MTRFVKVISISIHIFDFVADFKTIQQKIDLNKYKSFDSFVDDVQLVFDNCRQYNPETTIYAKNAKHMDSFFKKLLAQHEKQPS